MLPTSAQRHTNDLGFINTFLEAIENGDEKRVEEQLAQVAPEERAHFLNEGSLKVRIQAFETCFESEDEEKISLIEKDTPLQLAAKRGDIGIVTMLLQAGADIDRTIDSDMNITTCGSSLKSSYNEGYTPLYYAIKGEYTKTVKLLLERGANPYPPKRIQYSDFSSKSSLLHNAVLTGKIEIVKALLQKGAPINIKDADFMKSTPLEYIIRTTNFSPLECTLKMLRFLAFKGADLYDTEGKDRLNQGISNEDSICTPLDFAHAKDDVPALKLFLALGDIKEHLKDPLWKKGAQSDSSTSTSLLSEYRANPQKVKEACIKEYGKSILQFHSLLFSLMVLHSDECFEFKETPLLGEEKEIQDNICRFFNITKQLPQEIQMVLANRSIGSAEDNILLNDRLTALEIIL
jgi:ankyrin repeat protein